MKSVVAVFIIFVAPIAFAHELNMGIMKVATVHSEETGLRTTEIAYELNPKAAEQLASGDSDFAQKLIGDEVKQSWPTCTEISHGTQVIDENSVQMKAVFRCPLNEPYNSLAFPHLKIAANDLRVFARISNDRSTEETTGLLSRDKFTLQFEAAQTATLSELLLMGIQHIGAWPDQWYENGAWHFPEGIDHILFVIILAFAAGSAIPVLKSVTGFTVGHSLTLALGAFGLVNWPSSIVEFFIAMTIAYTALHALIKSKHPVSVKVSIVFGLIHGMGFASAIKEAHLQPGRFLESVLAFNIGVELGQLIILALIFPLIVIAKRYHFSAPVRVAVAGIVLVLSCYWSVERALHIF